MKYLVQKLAYQLTSKQIDEASLPVCEVVRKRGELSVFSLSTNPILSFTYEGKLWYFRECPRILAADDYWTAVIDRFFDSLDRLGISKVHFSQEIPVRIAFSEAEKASFHAYIKAKCNDLAFKKMLKNADRIGKRVSFSIWEKQTYDTAFFQLFALHDLPENCKEIAVYFLWNMRSAAGNFRLMNIVRGKQHSFFAAVRTVASRIVAEELNQAHLIAPYQWCRLMTDDGNTLFGIMSPAAPGGRMIDSAIPLSASLQRELLCLNVLDAICYQPDHGPNNYNVAVNEDGDVSVCAFDNDNPQTFFPWFTVCKPLAGCQALVDRNHQIQRPYMDRSLAVQVCCLDERKLCRRLKPYLNWLQIAAVCYRLGKVRAAIARTEKLSPGFLIDPACWSIQTVADEMGGEYGQTYLTKINSQDVISTSQ